VSDERQRSQKDSGCEGRETHCEEANAHVKPKERPENRTGPPPERGVFPTWAGSILNPWGLVRGFDTRSSRT
jgi:hypothetical protein